MADDIVIRIKTLLDRASESELNKVKKDIEQRVNPKIKIDVDSKGLDKYKEKYVQIENAEAKITERTKEWTKANGESVKQIEHLKAGTDEVYKKVTETTINYKKQRTELEKLNKEQSKYWSQRVKETVGDMTKKPDELVKMADYYDNLEKTNLETIKNTQNKNFNEAKQHLTQLNKLRQDYHSLGNKDTEQAKELTKQITYHQGQYNNIIRRKIDIGEKTKIEGIEAEKLIQLEKIREQTLRNVGTIKAKNIDKDIIQQQKLTSEIHKQSLAQQDLLNRIRGMRGVDGKFIVGDNLSALNTLESQIRGFDPTNKNFSKNMAEANSKLREISTTTSIYKKEIQDANKYTGLFGQSLLEAGKKFASWLLIGDVIIKTITAVKNGIQSIIDIDTALTNLNKVTDETRETLNKFSLEANAIGRNLAKTSVEVINSTTEFARLGYSLEQSAQLAKQALLYSNVGDIGVEEASLAIISAVKGFGVAVDEEGRNIQKIVDIYNEVGNNFAISSAGIGEAMRRSAASLYSAGNTMEEAVALITAANAVVQDPATVGTALKTISMRLRGVSEDGEDVLEYLPKLEESFKNIGIQIRKDENTFKSTYDIMLELALVWEKLTDVQRANMSELVAGKRQGNIVMAMMTNYKDMQDSLTTALNSTNSALIENEKYMESIEAKSAQFKNTVMGKWQEALNSDVIKGFVIAMTTLVEVLGNAEVVVALLTTAFLIWKGTAITSSIKAMIAFITTTNAANISLLALLTTTQGLTAAMNFLKATMATNPLGLLAVVATTAMVAIYGLTNATKKHREEQQKQIETSQNQIQNLKQQKEGLKELTSEYETLKDKEKNLTATTEEKKRLLEIQKELVDKYGVSATGINLEGEAYSDSIEVIKLRILALDEELKKEQELLEFKVKASDKQTNKEIKKAINLRDTAEKRIEEYQLMIDNNKGTEWYNLRKLEDWKDIYQRQQEEIYNLSKNKQKYLEYEAQETIKTLESNGKEMSDSAKLVVSEFAKSLALQPEDIETQQQALSDFATKVANSDLDSLIEQYNKLTSAINSGDDSKKNRDGLSKTSKEITNLINTLTKGNPDLKEFAINFASLYPSTIDSKNAINTLNQYEKALSDFQTTYKDNVSKIKDLKGFLDELSDKGLTQSSIEKIISDYQDYIPLLEDESKLRQQLVKDTEDYQNAIYDAFIKTKEQDINFYNSVKNNHAELFNHLSKLYGNNVTQWANLAQAREAIELQLISKLGSEWAKYFDAFNAGTLLVNPSSMGDFRRIESGSALAVDSKTNQMLKDYAEFQKATRDMASKFKNLNVSSSLDRYGSSSKSSKSFTKTFEVWKEALEAINREIETFKDQLDDVTSFEQKTEIYDQMILLLQKKQNLLLDINNTFDSSLKQAEQNLRSYIGKGLSESDFNKIMSGSTDTIEVDIKNEKIAKAIEDFKKLKDSAEGLKKEIQGIDDEIRDLSFAEFKINLSIEDIKLSDLTQEKENLRNEMSLLEKGSAEYIALLERENQINIESVNILRNKIALVQQELASDRYNADQKQELINTLKQLKQEYINLQFSIKQQLASIADEIISIYKNIYEKQKQVALDAIDEQMKAEEKRHKQATDNLDDELKQFEDYINARIKALDREENEHDYNRELEKKQKAILETQKNIDVLSLDDSFEAKAKKAELIKQLAEQEDEINEYQHDHSIDLRKENLKDQLDAYKKDIDAKKKAEDTKLNLEKDRLDRIKRETEKHYDDLINDEQKFAQIRSDIINGNIDKVKSAFAEFKTFVNGNLEFIGNSISANLITKMEQALALLESANSANMSIPSLESTNPSSNTSGRQPMAVLDSGSFELVNNRAIMQSRLLASLLGASADWEGYGQNQTIIIGGKRFKPAKNVDGTTYLSIREVAEALGHQVEWDEKKRQIRIYHEGGIVGDKSFGFVDKFNKFFNTSANEHIIKALTNEILIPPKNIERYLIPNMQKLIANATPQLQFAGGGNVTYNMNVHIDKVENTEKGVDGFFKRINNGMSKLGK